MLLCATITNANESGCLVNPETNSIQTDSVSIISEENKDYYWDKVGKWHYLLVNYSDGTSKMFDQNNNWVHFETEYEMDLITDEKTNKPLKIDIYWKKGGVKNVIEAEIADENGKMAIGNGVAEYITPYNFSVSFGISWNEKASNCIGRTFIYNGSLETSVFEKFFDLKELSGNDIIVKGPNGGVLQNIQIPNERRLFYYDETTHKVYIVDILKRNIFVNQACSISNGNTEIYDISSDDVVFVPCLPSDTISRFVWTEKVCEIYYSNGDYLKYTKQSIDPYDLYSGQIFDCIIHRPDGILTVKLEEALPNEKTWNGIQYEKVPVSRYEYTSGIYKGLINVDRNYERLKIGSVLGENTIINPSTGHYWKFINPKTNHVLTVTDKEGVLYDNTLKQYVTLDGKVKDFEKEAREKIEKERQQLYQKYGKKYVDALFDKGEILVETPEGLIKNHTQSTLINETQYTRTYRIKGWLNDWGATVDVNTKTGKVTAVRNRTL